ncbi:HNH endonuclease family protein [Lactococcus lactis]
MNEYLFCKEQDVVFNIDKSVDIEHIMPQSGLNRENIMKDAGFEGQDEFFEYAEKLGNKILLESEINRGIGDAWFRTKKENTVTSRHGYIGSKYQIAQSLVTYYKDTWTKSDIDVATDKAAKRISDYIFLMLLMTLLWNSAL